ncbi:MAG: tryptophan--tRNA ligase [Candidatus Odinarchaeia archaeon]
MMDEFDVSPWEVKGKVDYDKLIKHFGTEKITPELRDRLRKIVGELHPLIDRGFFFSHRDFDIVLEEYENGEKFFLYTGRGPTGAMHIGHLIPFIIVKWFQEKFNVNVYIQLTDDEKFLYKPELGLEETRRFALDNTLDIIACGFDPDKTFIFQDTEYTNIYPLSVTIAKKVTLSTAKAVFGFTNQSNIGLIFFPAIQAAPCFFEKNRCLIPAAIDQDPYWRIQRDVAPKLGYKKTAAIHSKFLPGLQGMEGKMSSSKGETAIYLTEKPEEVHRKIMKYAFTGGRPTLKEQKEKGGIPEICTVYQWLSAIFEPDTSNLKERKNQCKSGALICGECKKYLADKISEFLHTHQDKRKKAEKQVEKFKYSGKLAQEMWSRQW